METRDDRLGGWRNVYLQSSWTESMLNCHLQSLIYITAAS